MTVLRAAAAFATLLVLSPVAAAQSPAPQEEIVVNAPAVEEAIRNFVAELSAPPARENQLARWDHEVCVGVIGIQARYGQFLADRISQRAAEIGLAPAGPGCKANVVVFVTPDSGLLAREIVNQFQELMGVAWRDNEITQGREALDAFVASERPVRWWHVSNTVTADGQVLRDVPASQNSRGEFEAQVLRTTSFAFGRLSRTTRQDFSRVIIVVDATRAAGRRFDALADYVAMVALSQIAPDADPSEVPSILNLFDAASPPSAMTEWDIAYLTGLYEAPRTARNSGQQEAAIARSMGEQVATPPQR